MRVDLPEPLAPRIPWIAPRSRRSETSSIATTGGLRRSTVKRLVTCSTRSAGGPTGAGASGPMRPRRPGGRDPRGGLALGDAPAAGSTSDWSSSVRVRGSWSRDLLGGCVARWLVAEPVRGVPDMGRAAGPVSGGLRLVSGGAERCPKNARAAGPVAHGSVVAPGAYSPASYLLVGTPLPSTAPQTGAIAGAVEGCVLHHLAYRLRYGRAERPARPARSLRVREARRQPFVGTTNDVAGPRVPGPPLRPRSRSSPTFTLVAGSARLVAGSSPARPGSSPARPGPPPSLTPRASVVHGLHRDRRHLRPRRVPGWSSRRSGSSAMDNTTSRRR